MIWVCAWCRPGERLVKEIEPFGEFGITHGMCSRHEEEWRVNLERATTARKEETR